MADKRGPTVHSAQPNVITIGDRYKSPCGAKNEKKTLRVGLKSVDSLSAVCLGG